MLLIAKQDDGSLRARLPPERYASLLGPSSPDCTKMSMYVCMYYENGMERIANFPLISLTTLFVAKDRLLDLSPNVVILARDRPPARPATAHA